jgi:uncharacterized membrane protein YdjX (TVP38/TMEM64 family)
MIIQVIIPPIPAELIVIGSGNIYGIWTTTLVAGSGLFVGGVIVYFFGRGIAKGFHTTFEKEKVAKVIQRLREVETFILLVRILPYNPSDIISYAAGIIKINIKKYIMITFFVSFGRSFLLAYFGSYIEDIKTFFIIFAILFFSAILGWLFVFKKQKQKNQ